MDVECSHAGGCEGRPARGRGLAAVLRICSGQVEDPRMSGIIHFDELHFDEFTL